MAARSEAEAVLVDLLRGIQAELQEFNASMSALKANGYIQQQFLFLPFKGSEIYLLHKAFIDAGGAPNENYKSLLEKVVPFLSNKTQKGFSAQSFIKYSDKVDPESKDTVKRFLQRMIRNIDSYN